MSAQREGRPTAGIVGPGEGELGPRTGGRAPEVEIKLGAADGLGFSMVEYRVPPRFSPPPVLHRQTREDTAVYVLEGELRYWLGAEGREVVAGPGTLVRLPEGGWNRWANEQDRECRMLAVFAPAGFERFFLEVGAVAAAAQGDPDVLQRAIPELRERYGDEQLGD
ncbi:cupin domain-containing protein [Patulibacter minatonensis]|uniref:cupin domain-containing protein n=1 Tax=Patulibacter minatonensis TaxID=298163 RepID=UPI0004AC81C5|nr:cupin domain-containing protein [Patulibacter minatonensis]